MFPLTRASHFGVSTFFDPPPTSDFCSLFFQATFSLGSFSRSRFSEATHSLDPKVGLGRSVHRVFCPRGVERRVERPWTWRWTRSGASSALSPAPGRLPGGSGGGVFSWGGGGWVGWVFPWVGGVGWGIFPCAGWGGGFSPGAGDGRCFWVFKVGSSLGFQGVRVSVPSSSPLSIFLEGVV